MSTPPFPCSLNFPMTTPLIFNESMSSRSFKYVNFNTKLGWCSTTDWWQSSIPNFNLDHVLAKPNLLGDLGTYPIDYFRCTN